MASGSRNGVGRARTILSWQNDASDLDAVNKKEAVRFDAPPLFCHLPRVTITCSCRPRRQPRHRPTRRLCPRREPCCMPIPAPHQQAPRQSEFYASNSLLQSRADNARAKKFVPYRKQTTDDADKRLRPGSTTGGGRGDASGPMAWIAKAGGRMSLSVHQNGDEQAGFRSGASFLLE